MIRKLLLLVAFVVWPSLASAQPSFVGGATNLTTGTSISLNKPTGTVDNHIAVACIELENSGTVTAPSGWVEKGNSLSFTSMIARLYWKRMSGDPSSWTWTVATSTNWYGVVGSFSGAITTGDPFSFFSGNNNSGTTFPSVSGTTSVANELLIHCPMGGWTGALTPSSGFTLRVEESSGTARMTDKVQATAGATGSITGSHAGAATDQASLLVGLKPVAGGVSGAGAGGLLLRGVGP